VGQFTVEGKNYKEMSRYFDVDGTMAGDEGRSLRAERANRSVPRREMQKFKKEAKARKEDKKRRWLLSEEDPRQKAKRLRRERLLA